MRGRGKCCSSNPTRVAASASCPAQSWLNMSSPKEQKDAKPKRVALLDDEGDLTSKVSVVRCTRAPFASV